MASTVFPRKLMAPTPISKNRKRIKLTLPPVLYPTFDIRLQKTTPVTSLKMDSVQLTVTQETLKNWTKIFHCPTSLGAIEKARERVSGASKRANGWAISRGFESLFITCCLAVKSLPHTRKQHYEGNMVQ